MTIAIAECPLCHAIEPAPSRLGEEQGITWKCSRCSQRWDSARISAVAAHAEWLAGRAAIIM